MQNPPAINPQISGFAVNGPDSATFDPLCRFACSRGLCPDVNCVEVLDLITPSDLPGIDGADLDPLDPADFGTYVDGNIFTYVYPEDTQFSIDLQIAGPATTWTHVACGSTTGPGDYGDTLGCEAMSVAYLFYGIALNEIEQQDTDIHTRDSAVRGLHYQRSEEWAPEGNISTHHKLISHAPLDTWVIVGNGTYNNVPHEIHFIKHETMTGYRVVQEETLDTQGLLRSRGYGLTGHQYFGPTMAAYYQGHAPKSFKDQIDIERIISGPKKPAGVGDFIGMSVAKASAESGRQQYCAEFTYSTISGDGTRVDDTTEPGVLVWGSTALNASTADFGQSLTKCIEENKTPPEYVIYPRDPFDIDDITRLLSTFVLAGVVANPSISGWGMLYWTAFLTDPELAEVKAHKQVSRIFPRIFLLKDHLTN